MNIPIPAIATTILLSLLFHPTDGHATRPEADSSIKNLIFFIGTYTAPPSKSLGIYTAFIHPQTRKLSRVQLAVKTPSPSFLAIGPDQRTLYATADIKKAAICAFRIHPDPLHPLTPLNSKRSPGTGTCHLSISPRGITAFAANYGTGSLCAWPLRPDGSIAGEASQILFKGHGPNEKRQKKPHAHGVYPSPDGRQIYTVDLGSDKIWIHQYHPDSGTLTPASPGFATVPPGSGPRHLAFHPSGKFVYVNNELTNTVTAFQRNTDTGILTEIQTLNGDFPPSSSAEIACHPSGRWLYVSLRGSNLIAVYDIQNHGTLKLSARIPAEVKWPRSFDIDPSGRWLVIAGKTDHRIALFAINPTTGQPAFTGSKAEVPTPVCILFPKPLP